MSEKKVYYAGIVQLDPADCGSSISYSIIRAGKDRFEAVIDLSDCSRKIQWYFNFDDIPKINNVVSILSQFKKEYLKAIQSYKKEKK